MALPKMCGLSQWPDLLYMDIVNLSINEINVDLATCGNEEMKFCRS